MSRISAIIASLIILLIVSLARAVNHYRDNALNYKEQLDKATSDLMLAKESINDMQVRQREVSVLDEKYTGELSDAKAENDRLSADIVAGKRQLQLKATCTPNGAVGTPGMVNGSNPRHTADAELNYWRLRDGIETVTRQLKLTGLQAYVREQCIK